MMSKAAKYFLKPDPRDYVDKDSKPKFSLWAASFKMVAGFALLNIVRAMDYVRQISSLSDIQIENKRGDFIVLAEAAGCALLLEATSDIANLGILYLYKMREDAHVATELKSLQKLQGRDRKAKRNQPTLTDEEREIARYHRVLRVENIIHSSLGIVATFVAVRQCIEGFHQLPSGSTIFDLSFPEGTNLNNSGLLNFLRMPLTNTVNMVMFSLGLVYNIRETLHSIKASRPRRGDVPVFGLINANAIMGLSASLVQKFTPEILSRDGLSHLGIKDLLNLQIDDIPKLGDIEWAPGSSFESKKLAMIDLQAKLIKRFFIDAAIPGKAYHTFVVVNSAAYLKVLTNIIQIGLNTRFLFFQNKSENSIAARANLVVTEELQPQKISNDSRLLHRAKLTNFERQRFFDTNIFSKEERHQKAPERIKTKTKGTASDAFKEELEVPLTKENEVIDTLCSIYSPKTANRMADLRTECLEKVQELRGLKQVPVKTIKGLLNKLENFLPNGDISGVDGSNYQIAWSWEKKRTHMDFETPHGKDPSRFHRRKLEKVLNVLEAGFLWGWQKEKIDAHLERRSGKRSLSDLAYVFTERPK